MSSNNQTLIVEHEDKFYVFRNIMAESWSDKNELEKSKWEVFDSHTLACEKAMQYDEIDDTEYGIFFDELAKDDGQITLI